MWELFTEIFKTLNPKSWPARFSSLKPWKQLFVIMSTILLILLALIVAGHFSKIGVSIGPTTSPNQWSVPLRLFNPLSVLDAGLLLFSVYFMATATTTGKKEEKPEQLEEVVERDYPQKLTVHVALPTGEGGQTLGDGLLQAAGFLAGEEYFEEYIKEIKVYDHENDKNRPDCSVKILKEILDENRDNKDPVCIVYTMSTICEDVKKAFERECENDPSLKERTSIIFTVASRPDKPCDGKNVFQHFVTGDKEAKAIIDHCKDYKKYVFRGKKTNPQAIVLTMDSPYSIQTGSIIISELSSAGFDSRSIYIGKKGEFPKEVLDLIDKSKREDKGLDLIFIAIAYDLTLLRIIENLNNKGYKGPFLASTTLSVLDWQDHVRNEIHPSDEFRVWYTCIKGFDLKNKPASYFAHELENGFDFEEVIRDKRFYVGDVKLVRKMFNDDEQKIYEKIQPNYISAFCFDAIRLFAQMRELGYRKLSEFDFSEKISNCGRYCPFQNLKYHSEGWTEVPITSEEVVLAYEKNTNKES